MKSIPIPLFLFFLLISFPVRGQQIGSESGTSDRWDRTQEILKCAPRLVDRRDLVEDNFDHRYVTNNPRDIELGYFSVEPTTYFEERSRFCEASLPAAGVSDTYFRGTYETLYTLPGKGVYRIHIESNALVFNNGVRIINAQNTVASIDATHRLQIIADTTLHHAALLDPNSVTADVYHWEVEVEEGGSWEGSVCTGDCNDLHGEDIPIGNSNLEMVREYEGPGVITIRESVIFQVDALSAYKYEPIFQVLCLFNLEPLSISAKLLPCEE